ncbi:MAG: hypothetical protein HOK80_06690, partial [Candidatus Cloacimonetes bacterium]|nr:hypothetical protein [Candidatus Cloacimonadota bacterium]
MKFKLFILFVLISVYSLLNSTTWHIKQDGTGNFTTIQEGINASVDSDTILVYPGTYFENVNYNGKSITVASLFLTTQNEDYINQTIIDGNQNGSCVRMISGEDSTTVICGFTISNGSGTLHVYDYLGGGLYIVNSQPTIKKCIIKNNNANAGGGIYCIGSQIELVGVSIHNNHSYASGGGIFLHNSEINFNSEILCNIYLNYASGGCEISKTWTCPPMEVYIDTFTVFEPDGYFISSTNSIGVPLNDVILNAQHAKFEPVNSDLFVSVDGNNSNNGLTPDEPLVTINYALSLIKSDSLHPNTIFLTNGHYSKSINNQCFPLNMRGYISLEGESMDNTILDAEEDCALIWDSYSELDYSLKNFTLSNGFHNI